MASNSGNPRTRKPEALRAHNIHHLGFMAENAALCSDLMLAYPLDFDALLVRECNTPFEESWQGERFKVICVESTWPSRLP